MTTPRRKRRGGRRRKATPDPEPVEEAAPEPVVEATEADPLVLSKTFPPGVIIQPDVKPVHQVRPWPPDPVKCPYCRTTKVKRTSTKGRSIYFECQRCVDRETLKLTRFKVTRPPR